MNALATSFSGIKKPTVRTSFSIRMWDRRRLQLLPYGGRKQSYNCDRMTFGQTPSTQCWKCNQSGHIKVIKCSLTCTEVY